ncbi:MAG: serine/threonine-protein kinase, partial [Rubripirellula sp.]
MTQSREPFSGNQGGEAGEATDLQPVAQTNPAETQDSERTSRFPKIDGYKVTAVLGRGGMGVVYRASDLKLKRDVAIKMVLVGQFASAEQLARFRSEAETVARLRHPSIVQIFDVGEYQSQPYLTFELVEGPSLARLAAGVPQTPEFAAEMIEIVSRAVQYAHDKSVVHRDLKPGNILLEQTDRSSSRTPLARVGSSIARKSSSGSNSELKARTTSGGLVPKISDFGLAKQLDVDAQQTTTGQVLGTARYMAPEQAEGRNIGPAADVYSLGTILYELLAGRTPFHGATTVETLQMLREDEPIPLRRLQPRLPRDLETICMKALEKDPLKRYACADALADDLRGFLRDEPISARPVGRMERGLKWARRRPAVAFLIGTLVLVIGLAFLGVTWQWQKTLAAQREGAETQVDLLLDARPEAVSTVVSNLTPYRQWVDPKLTSMLQQPDLSPHDRDRVSLGLLPIDPGRLEYLVDRMNATDKPLELVDFLVVRDAIYPYRDEVAPRQWNVLLDDTAPAVVRLRNAVALAHFDPPTTDAARERWSQVSSFVAVQFATQANLHPNQHATLTDSLYPIRNLLLPALVEQLHNGALSDSQKSTTTSIVADFAHDDPKLLVDLAVVSDATRHAVIQPKLSGHPLKAVGLLRDVLDQEPSPELTEAESDALARRRAIAAITLSHLGRSDLLWR